MSSTAKKKDSLSGSGPSGSGSNSRSQTMMDRFVTKTSRLRDEDTTAPNVNCSTKKLRMEFSMDDIAHDPAKRISIDSYDPNVRNHVRIAYLLKGPCQPRDHEFPVRIITGENRRFNPAWFDDYAWLDYSISTDSAYCLYCYLFKKVMGSQSGAGVFVSKGYENWKKATGTFRDHVGTTPNTSHEHCRRNCEDLQNQRQSVSYVLSKQDFTSQGSYRVRLTLSLWSARYLLGQGLEFRAHDESNESDNRGNFRELVSWCENISKDLTKHIGSQAPGNNQMVCPDIQKDLANACATLTIDEIIKDIGESFYALLVDESRDNASQEQMAVVLRYVNKHGQVMERFIAIEHVSDTSSNSLKSAIDNLFSLHKLSIYRLRGQGYDGASNMSGRFNGLKSKILEENPSAYFVHCFAHQLQLAIVAVAKNNLFAGDFFNYANIIVNTVAASCKRLDSLKRIHHDKVLADLESGDISSGTGKNQEMSLKRPGDTRWGSYHTTIIRLITMWSAVIDVLENIQVDGCIGEQRSMAMSMGVKMKQYQFVFTMHLMKKVLGITNELSQALQRKDQDIVNAMDLVHSVKHILHTLRENEWDMFLTEVNAFCEKHSIVVPNMDDSAPTRRRGEVGVTYFQHFRVEVFCQVIDLIVEAINSRFTVASTELLLGISCLSPNNSFEAFDHVKLLGLAKLYPSDFSMIDLVVLEDQLQTYIDVVKRNDVFSNLCDIGNLARKMVEKKLDRVFPLVYRLLRLALTLPVSTATVERVFSAMNIIKSDLRNRMGNRFLNDCMVCFVEKKIFKALDDECILQHFQKMKPRRMQLPAKKYC